MPKQKPPAIEIDPLEFHQTRIMNDDDRKLMDNVYKSSEYRGGFFDSHESFLRPEDIKSLLKLSALPLARLREESNKGLVKARWLRIALEEDEEARLYIKQRELLAE